MRGTHLLFDFTLIRSESGLFIFHVTDRNSYNVFKLPIQSRKYITSQTVKNLKQMSLQFIKKMFVIHQFISLNTRHHNFILYVIVVQIFMKNIPTDFWAEKNHIYSQCGQQKRRRECDRQTDGHGDYNNKLYSRDLIKFKDGVWFSISNMPNRQEKNSRGVNDSVDNYHEFDR